MKNVQKLFCYNVSATSAFNLKVCQWHSVSYRRLKQPICSSEWDWLNSDIRTSWSAYQDNMLLTDKAFNSTFIFYSSCLKLSPNPISQGEPGSCIKVYVMIFTLICIFWFDKAMIWRWVIWGQWWRSLLAQRK